MNVILPQIQYPAGSWSSYSHPVNYYDNSTENRLTINNCCGSHISTNINKFNALNKGIDICVNGNKNNVKKLPKNSELMEIKINDEYTFLIKFGNHT